MSHELQLLESFILELKQIHAYCSGACSVMRNSELVTFALSVNNAIKDLIDSTEKARNNSRALVKSKEVITKEVVTDFTVPDVLVTDMGFDRRVENIVHGALVSFKRSASVNEFTGPHWLSDIAKITLVEWCTKPGMGANGLAQLYWICHNHGYEFDIHGMRHRPKHKAAINLLENKYSKESK